jgi:hypothetical protein
MTNDEGGVRNSGKGTLMGTEEGRAVRTPLLTQEKYAWERCSTPSLPFPGDPRMFYLSIDQHKRDITDPAKREELPYGNEKMR